MTHGSGQKDTLGMATHKRLGDEGAIYAVTPGSERVVRLTV